MASDLASTLANVPSALKAVWWTFLLRGIFGVALGILALAYPGATLAAVVFVVGFYFVLDGMTAMYNAIMLMKADRSWGRVLASGILSAIAGLIIILWPGLGLLYLVWLIAVWAVFTGVLEISAAIRLRKVVSNEWLYVVFGVISIVFGFCVIAAPGLGLFYLVTLVAAYGFLTGVTMLGLAWRARKMA